MSILERELLLSQGGGIYYDEARVAADEHRGTLFIGLGGTGADMLIRVKNQVKRRLELPKNNTGSVLSDTPNNIGFLVLDTDENSAKKSWGSATFRVNEEFCSLKVSDLAAAIVAAKVDASNGDPIWNWYDGMDSISATADAGGIRQMGRFMLFKNSMDVWGKITKKMTDIKYALNSNSPEQTEVLNIIICAGIAGGTGSGTLLDVAYMVRQIAINLGINDCQIFGYVVLPDVNLTVYAKENEFYRNGFAALKELDYWMSSGKTEQDINFTQKYPGNIEVNLNEKLPFDYCHLISAQDLKGSFLKYNDVMDAFAENVFAYIANEVTQGTGNTAMSSMYTNILAYNETAAKNGKYPACHKYLAVGTEKLEVPYEEISTLIAARLFQLLRPTLELRPDAANFEKDMDVRYKLRTLSTINTLFNTNMPQSPRAGKNYGYKDIWGGADKLRKAYEEWFPKALAQLKENSKNYVRETYQHFIEMAKEDIGSLEKGPNYVAAVLSSGSDHCIERALEMCVAHCRARVGEMVKQFEELEEKANEAYQKGLRSSMIERNLNPNAVVAPYVNALDAWQRTKLGIELYKERAEKLEDLAERLKRLNRDVFSKLSKILDELPDIFERNYNHIKTTRETAEKKGELGVERIIWPLDFEKEYEVKLKKLLNEEKGAFLREIPSRLKEWIGISFDDLAYEANPAPSSGIDISGYVSRFISAKFNELLTIKMEEVIKRRLDGAETLENYLSKELVRMREDATPMFRAKNTHLPSNTSKFALVSVPKTCDNIVNLVEEKIEGQENLKRSVEENRICFVRVAAGLPLYSYGLLETMETKYEEMTARQPDGIHLRGKQDKEYLPSPIPEAAWTPATYKNDSVTKKNKLIRDKYDLCVEKEIIQQIGSEWVLLESEETLDPSKMRLNWDMDDDLRALDRLRRDYWSPEKSNKIVLKGVGSEPNPRESVLRLPEKYNKILKQAEIFMAFEEKRRYLENPKIYAHAFICDLVSKDGFEMVLKKSPSDRFPEVLGMVRGGLMHDFNLFEQFCTFLDSERRENISEVFKGLARAAATADGKKEKEQISSRINEILEKYPKDIQEIKDYMQELEPREREGYKYALYFYESVDKVCKMLNENLESFKD